MSAHQVVQLELRSTGLSEENPMASHIEMRWAKEGDFEAVFDLACQLAQHIEAPRPPLTLIQFRAFYIEAGAPMRLLLAIDSGRVLGIVSWAVTHELYCADARIYVADLAVDDSARGAGIGRALMNEVVAWGRAHDINKLTWHAWQFNEVAKAFCEKFGGRVDDEAVSYAYVL